MKLKIISVILIIYVVPGLYFSSEYGYFNTHVNNKLNGSEKRRNIVEVLSASYSSSEAKICASVSVDNEKKVVSFSFPLDLSGVEEADGGYKIVSNMYKYVMPSSEMLVSGCDDKALQNDFNLITLPAALSSIAGVSVQYENINEKKPNSLYIFQENGAFSYVVVNLDDPKLKFDDYFLNFGFEQKQTNWGWYIALPIAKVADALTYPLQYLIYVNIGIA